MNLRVNRPGIYHHIGGEMTEVSEEAKVLATLARHRQLVTFFLRELARRLEARADLHDQTKYAEDEFEIFVEIQKIARTEPYGSPAYMASVERLGLHYERNPHHPEHWPNGVSDMGLVDFLEMVMDWLAANYVFGNVTQEESRATQSKRFDLQPEHEYLVGLIFSELENAIPRRTK